jgi:DNA-binding NtrC family response regulator
LAQDIPHTQQILDADRLIGLRRRRLRIEVLKGEDRKQRRDFDGDRIVVGTHASCDFVLTDATVSRQHCEIAYVAGGYAIRDLDSTNGTFIDRVRARDVIVDRETRVRVGDTQLRLLPLDETVDLPLAVETRFGALSGRSAAMRRVFDLLRKIAPTDATLLISGESGTGKEVAARSIHEASPRARGPFVVVDCGALPATLIESELYGHERGAFSGAVRSRIGAFEAATGGTLFLDEVGELPVDLQTRLLGVLERRRVQPLGSTESRAVDVRVVAATNRDLRREVNRGSFREDLYFRLAVVTLEMPALRDHGEDIPLYVEEFLVELATDRPGFTVDAETMQRLAVQTWPGNVRELRNVLERAAALGEVELAAAVARPATDEAPALPRIEGGIDVSLPFKVGKAALVEQYERVYVERLIQQHKSNITRAARAAEIDRVYLLRLLDKYGLRPRR